MSPSLSSSCKTQSLVLGESLQRHDSPFKSEDTCIISMWDGCGRAYCWNKSPPSPWKHCPGHLSHGRRETKAPRREQRWFGTEAAILAEIFFRIMCPFNPGQEFVSRSADMALSIIHGIVYFPADSIMGLGDDSAHQLHHLIHGDQDLIKRSQHRRLI